MSTLVKLACSLAILATVAFAAAPARAQFEGAGDQMAQFAPMMEQFAPMMQMMKSKMSKKRMDQMMRMVGPMMSSMMASGGDDFTGLASMPGMEDLMSMMGESPTGHARRRQR
jgi:hypothetical protein